MTAYAHRFHGLEIIEMSHMAHGATWAAQPEDGYILIQLGLSEEDRRRALAEALTEMVASAPATTT